METTKGRFKKMFPHLAQEMEGKESETPITSVRSHRETAEKAASERFEGYNPDVIDFLRRCDTEQQAGEIIRYLEQKKEISREYAAKLRKQLNDKGVRSFGPKKDEDYYFKQAGV